VKPRLFRSRACRLGGLLLLLTLPGTTQAKPIRLRAETILPESPTNLLAKAAAQSAAAQARASGLFLIQLEGTATPAQQAELHSLGVELLKYVPEDAFIARVKNLPLGKVMALSYVHWVGPYRPDYKIHPRLAAAAKAAPQGKQTLAVTVLLSPGVTSAEVARARALFASVAHESLLRQGTFVRGELPAANLEVLSQLDFVLWVERAPRRKLVDEAASKIVGGDDGRIDTPTVTQQLGFAGAGVTICVADTGLDTGNTNTMHPDLRGRVIGFQAYGTNIVGGADGYGHGTHCAGIVAGNAATGEIDPDMGGFYGLGVASQANLFIERLFDDTASEAQPFPSDDMLTGDAVRHGAHIGSNSWGNDVQGEYDTDAAQFDELVRDADPSNPGEQPYILEFSSGNAGPDSQTVGSPATAKNVIATGASQNVPGFLAQTYGLYADGADTMADFSSRGPCEDGRIKPDVVAPGTWIASAASSAAMDIASVSWTAIDDYYVYMGGTSMSGPHAAGAAAVFVQYYKSLHTNAVPSPALVKAALINSAGELDVLNGGPGPIPNNDEGWGRVTLTNIVVTNVLTAPRYYEYVDQSVLLTNGEVYSRHTLVQSSTQPLKFTLAYTDVPGFPGTIPALVNDLDVEVVAPDGTLYRGNQFTGSDSVPNAPSPDALNNVEAVHLAKPAPGDYLVRVRARRVVKDARVISSAAIDQDFALVVSGDLARPGRGTVLLDRHAYTAPDLIRLTVFDLGRAGSSTVSVNVRSASDPTGQNVTLQLSGSSGAFTGAVATVVAPAGGGLKVLDRDAIEADYVDSSGATRLTTAVADLAAPSISDVTTALDLGVFTITWLTIEPASSIVRYGTNQPPTQGVTNALLSTRHTVRLGRLIPGRTYYFYLGSADGAGNLTTTNNGGAYYSFVAVATPTVLLVDAYDPVDGSPVIPDSTYTNALTAAGYSYAYWKVSQRGGLQLADLQPFPVVVWRPVGDILNYGVDEDGIADPYATNNTLSAGQQAMIQDYLNGGGSFFMASMGILTELGNVPFRRNVLQVAGFKQNPDRPSPCDDCDECFGVPSVLGASGDSITSGMYADLDYSLYPKLDLLDILDMDYGPDFSDTFSPATNATAIFFESASGKPCGMSYPPMGVDSPGRVVFLSFPLETVPASGVPTNTEVVLLRNVLKFLTPGLNGVGSIALNNNVYSIPDQITVEVGDSDLAGAGSAQVTFSTSSSTNRITLVLNESTRPGLFRGYLTLTATNAPNKLTVLNGDTITATYSDTSNHSNAVATAIIDTVPPAITNVAAVTSFGDATVSWRTSKPADALVQFGESVLLGRTAYRGSMVTNHAVAVGGLLANRDYYYQVVSRDSAGNTTVDDNHGALYTFTTRAAPRPPLSYDFEDGAGDWTTVPDAGSTNVWQLGTPNNSLDTSANSGTNAWGANLRNQPMGFKASCFLVSPPIDLSGFSSAQFTFWHNCDFTSSIVTELGIVGVSTNSGTPLIEIPDLMNFLGYQTFGWEQATGNLTAFVGQTVQLVWFYQGYDVLFPPNGWLVDDVEVTGVLGGGTIVVNKNLGQGKFTLTGLIGQSGTAPTTTITNAPPGPYTVDFTDVPFYQTPPEQTLTLTNGGTITFTGNYGFLDANFNGISDSWERYYFGSAPNIRPPSIDSDGDGMSDYAEFIAGTNPTNAASKLVFLSAGVVSNKFVRLEWAAIPGRLYQVESASVFSSQTPTRLSGTVDRNSGAFKLHVEAQTNLAYAVQFSTNLGLWTSVYTNATGGKLDWTDAAAHTSVRRFYRTLNLSSVSTNSGGWAPVGDWLQATGSPMSYTTTNASQGLHVFRVQVRP
jgi:subtilisin family serine protease